MNQMTHLYREGLSELRNENERLVSDNEELEAENEKLKARVKTLESLVKRMVEDAGRLGVSSDAWDVRIAEYKHWDL